MYERFYGLSRTPFAVTPDPAMLYMSRVHREALATIVYGVETRKGFLVCTGEVGTGKSTIIRAFFDQAQADAVRLIYIFMPQVSPLEMAQYICSELGLTYPESVFAAVPQLQLKLLETFESGKTVVLMIDEAQLLPPETLEFLRLLSNFETDTEKLIQIVLVGQPEVDTMLARRDMRQVNQRVALRARLGPFSAEESVEYIAHRLKVAGASELEQVMSPSAAWIVAEAGGGIPRTINILADNALIAGFAAAQRPLGSHLAGNTVREFLAKSGPARPAGGAARLGFGWGKLRSALVREKAEPAEWSPQSAPAPTPVRVVQQPRRVQPAPLRAATPTPTPPAMSAAAPVSKTGREPAPVPVVLPPPPVPARSEAVRPIEPVFVGFEEPAEPLPVARPKAEPPVKPAPPPAAGPTRENGAAGGNGRAVFVPPAPARVLPSVQWPVLSRVRSDLQVPAGSREKPG